MAMAASLMLVAGAISACGGSNATTSQSGTTPSGGGKVGGTASVLMGGAPDALDPAVAVSPQAIEALWVSRLGLLSLAHAEGAAGGNVIPALASALPTVTQGGRTYTLSLRPGLKYSDGKPVKASDFTYSIERDLKMKWGGSFFLTSNIAGADAFAAGKAKTISGITTNDATGRITIKLVAPNGAFSDVLAGTGLGFVPTGTPMTNLTDNPPPSVGPYTLTNVVPDKSFTAKINPQYSSHPIPGIPAAAMTVNVTVQSNNSVETEQVLQNQADLFDPNDQIAPSLFSQIQSQARDRFKLQPVNLTYYFFLNTKTKPFSSELARQAVDTALDRRALARLASGNVEPGCYMLPPELIGHPTAPCPHGSPNAAPNIAKAKQLVARSGMAGQPVTVWGRSTNPDPRWVSYYAGVLKQLGFKPTEKIIPAAEYSATVGSAKVNPQTGVDFWGEDYPDPSDFYVQLDARNIAPTSNLNLSQVNDPKIQQGIISLSQVPAGDLAPSASKWQALDRYATDKSYYAIIGYSLQPKFTSNRIDYRRVIFATNGIDWTSLHLK